MNPRIALFLLAIPAIACGGRSDLVDLPASAPVDASPCSVRFKYLQSFDASIADTVASAQVGDAETPSVFVACQGAAEGTVYEFSGRYELGHDTMQATWRSNGSSRGQNASCTVKAQLNGGFTTPGQSLRVGDPFSITFGCQLETDLAVYEYVHGTLSAPLTAR